MSNEKEKKLSVFEKGLQNIGSFDKFLENKMDNVLLRILNISRYAFISIMMLYLIVCLMSLGHKIIYLTLD